jgi:hypothetical protein
MSQVIRISDDLYKRLEVYASGFDTPAKVIEKILDEFEGVKSEFVTGQSTSDNFEIQPSSNLEIIYFADSEEDFKQQLLDAKKAFLKIYFTNNTSEIKEWDASRFSSSSRVDGNLRSGYLRGWKERGIVKAEVTVNRADIT